MQIVYCHKQECNVNFLRTNIVKKYVMVFRNQAPRFYIKENLPLKNQVIFGAGAPCALQEIVASLPSNAVRFCGGLIIMGDDAKIQNVRYIFVLIVTAMKCIIEIKVYLHDSTI